MTVKHNPYQSIIFQIEAVRNKTPKLLAEEYYIFISALFGRKIEEAAIRLSDYKDMTMYDVRDEIHIRTNMTRGDNRRKIQQYKDKKKKDQDKAIQELLTLQ